MRLTTVIASALTAASVIAAPLERRAIVTSWVIEVVTKTSTVYGVPKPTASPVGGLQKGGASKPSSTKPAPPPAPTTTPYVPPPAPSTTPVEVAPPPPSTTPAAPVPAPSPPSTGPAGSCGAYNPNPDFNTPTVSCGVSIIDTVNKWRRAYGKSDLTWASNLAQAAWTTVTTNRGGPDMIHPGLIDGAMGETISPGFWDTATLDSPDATQGESPFELALMGWLCEVSSDPQLQASGPSGKDQCGIVGKTTFISGSANANEPTGHHDIFISDSYNTIACMYRQSDSGGQPSQWAGQWACDFGF